MKRLYLIVCVSAFSMVGCFGSGGEGGDKGPVPLNEMATASATIICQIVEQCIAPGFFGSDCVTSYSAQFQDSQQPQLQDAVDRGTMNYDADKMRDCLDAMESMGCDAFDNSAPPAACDEAMAGTVAPTGSCFIDEECAGDAFCNDGISCPGTCEAHLPLNADCSMGGRCGGSADCFNGVCTAPAQLNQPCGGRDHPYCGSGLDCEGGMDGLPGTCIARPAPTLAALDAACNPENSQFCQSGLSCVVTGLEGGEVPIWACKAAVASGAACNFGVPDQCPAAEFCSGQFSPTNVQGTCTILPGENQPCADSMGGEGCAPGMVCNDGICFRPKRLTEGCQNDWDCVSDYCDETGFTCAVPEC